jgi:hypothetical protein
MIHPHLPAYVLPTPITSKPKLQKSIILFTSPEAFMNKENTVLGFSLAPFEHRNTEDLCVCVCGLSWNL